MRNLAVLVLLLLCGAALASSADHGAVPAHGQRGISNIPPRGVRLFDLHDPGLMTTWAAFLATTPMLNEELLPLSLQDRLANVVATYRSLTPADRPAFFVATYVDLLTERLLSGNSDAASKISPMQVCPVFASGNEVSASSLLAMASGLPDELFENAPGQPERYRYLFLQTEFSHCRFLATIQAAEETRVPANEYAATTSVNLSFNVGVRPYTAILSSEDELRALVETVGDIDATTMFRRQMADQNTVDEAEVLRFIRLLSLLATDGKNGYAAIPVLFPLLSEPDGVSTAEKDSMRIGDALEVAYQAREAFRKIVPFVIRDTDELLNAKLAVMQALAAGGDYHAADDRVRSLLGQFVTGSDLLLVTAIAQERMPPIND